VQRHTRYDATPRYGTSHNDYPRCSEKDAQCVSLIIQVSQIILISDPLDGHYLNIPVVEEDGRLVAIVDVLKLTYATLEQVRSHLYYRIYSYLLTSLSDEPPVG
jgi:hypothetical protein